MEFKFLGNHYGTGDHYVHMKNKDNSVTIHVNLFLSKLENSRLKAILQNTFGYYSQEEQTYITEYIKMLYQKRGLSSIEVVHHFSARDACFDAVALADYLDSLFKKAVRKSTLTKADNSLKDVGILKLKKERIVFDFDLEDSVTLCWIRGTYLTDLLGLTKYHTKREFLRAFANCGVILLKRVQDYDMKLSLKGATIRGHLVDINFKNSDRYNKQLTTLQDRYQRQLKHNKSGIYTQLEAIKPRNQYMTCNYVSCIEKNKIG